LIANVRNILAIELLCACQALDFLAPLRSGTLAEQARRMVRKVSPHIAKDRPLHADITRLSILVSQRSLARLIAPEDQV
jgi:histidine ammonia-lyase